MLCRGLVAKECEKGRRGAKGQLQCVFVVLSFDDGVCVCGGGEVRGESTFFVRYDSFTCTFGQ